jgi:hypothetical protein
MISFSSLPGTKTAADCNPKEILLARETYEYACLLSVALCAALPESERVTDDKGNSTFLLTFLRFITFECSVQDLQDIWLKLKLATRIMHLFFRLQRFNSNFRA